MWRETDFSLQPTQVELKIQAEILAQGCLSPKAQARARPMFQIRAFNGTQLPNCSNITSLANMCLTHRTESLSLPQPVTIRVLINQGWDQDFEQNKGFKQKKYSFLIKKLHLLLNILHTVLPSGNTCQLCKRSLQNFTKNAIPLPDGTTFARYGTKFCCNWTKKKN